MGNESRRRAERGWPCEGTSAAMHVFSFFFEVLVRTRASSVYHKINVTFRTPRRLSFFFLISWLEFYIFNRFPTGTERIDRDNKSCLLRFSFIFKIKENGGEMSDTGWICTKLFVKNSSLPPGEADILIGCDFRLYAHSCTPTKWASWISH